MPPLQHTAGLWAAKPPVEVDQDSLAAESAASPQSKASHVSSLLIVAPEQGSELDCAAYSAANDPEKCSHTQQERQPDPESSERAAHGAGSQKSSQSQEEQRMPFRSSADTHDTTAETTSSVC